MKSSVSLSQLDLFIYFYLQECGFIHSAFTFSQESNLSFLKMHHNIIPPGLLISLIQRGISYTKIETNSSPIFRNNGRSPIENFLLNDSHMFQKLNITADKVIKKSVSNFFRNKYSIFCFLWHTCKQIVYFGTRESKFFKWEAKTTDKKKKTPSHFSLTTNFLDKKDVFVLDMNLLGTLIATGLNDGHIVILTETGKILRKFFMGEKMPSDLKWSENSRSIAITNKQGNFLIYSVWHNQIMIRISVFKTNLIDLNWLNNENIIIGSKEKNLCVCGLTKKTHSLFKINSAKINGLFVSPDKTVLACLLDSKIISIWNINSQFIFKMHVQNIGVEIETISWKPRAITKFQNKNNGYFLIISNVNSLNFWNIENGICTKTISEKSHILSINWCATGNNMILTTSSGQILLYDNLRKKKVKFLCEYSNFLHINIQCMSKNLGCLTKNSIYISG